MRTECQAALAVFLVSTRQKLGFDDAMRTEELLKGIDSYGRPLSLGRSVKAAPDAADA